MRVRLTPKQLRIVQLCTEGLTQKEIGQQTGNTRGVIGNYLRGIYDLTGMSNRLELALWYLEKGIVNAKTVSNTPELVGPAEQVGLEQTGS